MITIVLVENEDNSRILLEAALQHASEDLSIAANAYFIEHFENRQPDEVQRYIESYSGPLLLTLDMRLDTHVSDPDKLLKYLLNSYLRMPERLKTGPRRAIIVYSNAAEIIRRYQSQQSGMPPIFFVPKYAVRDKNSEVELQHAFKMSLAYLQSEL